MWFSGQIGVNQSFAFVRHCAKIGQAQVIIDFAPDDGNLTR